MTLVISEPVTAAAEWVGVDVPSADLELPYEAFAERHLEPMFRAARNRWRELRDRE